MQVPSVPPPIFTNTLPQDVAAKAVPNAQAVAPLVPRAVDPAHKDERFNEVRRKEEKPKDSRGNKKDQKDEGNEEEDHSVNIRI
ncbi:MAG: hypothetical protein WC464_08310 [Bdellovibrionales bacterium]